MQRKTIYFDLHIYVTQMCQQYCTDTLFGKAYLIHNSAINFMVLTLHHSTFNMRI
jgi:hypothetical protein